MNKKYAIPLVLLAVVAVVSATSMTVVADEAYAGQEFFAETVIDQTNGIDINQTNPYWQELETITIYPHGINNVLYGVKYTVSMSLGNEGLNHEMFFRVRIDTSDNRTFYTNWVKQTNTTPEEYEHNEVMSDIQRDYSWATGYHNHGLVADQDWYKFTMEAGVSLTNGTIHDYSLRVYQLAGH